MINNVKIHHISNEELYNEVAHENKTNSLVPLLAFYVDLRDMAILGPYIWAGPGS